MGDARTERSTANGPRRELVGESKTSILRAAANPAGKVAKRKRAVTESAAEKRTAKAALKARSARPHTNEVPEGLPKKYYIKSTFNTHDIMHSPVEKTLKMLDKILSGERLFTM